MQFRFELEKAIQAIGVLFRAEQTQVMSYLRLLKLLYIAERENLAATGWPILGDRAVAMDNGPVMSQVYDLIMDRHIGAPRWGQYFRRSHYCLEKVTEADVGRLSRQEIDRLQEIAHRYEDISEWDLVNVTHDFADYVKNKPPKKSMKPISVEDILEGVGKSNLLASIEQEREDAEIYDGIFGG